MVRTGAYAYAKYGYESSFGGSATINKSFGQKTSITGWTLQTNRQALGKLGQVEPTKYVYGTQNGTLGVGFVLANTTSHDIFKSIYGAPTGSGTTSSPYSYGGLTQGDASKTFIGQTFSTEIGFTGETDTMVRTLKGCILNSLSISASIGDVVNCSADIVYGKEDAHSTTTTTAATENSQPFTFAHGSLKVGGSLIAEVQEVDISFTQNGDLLYELGSQQAVTGIKKILDITGRFKASWKNDDALVKLIAQLKGTGFSETYGGSPELELNFSNGQSVNPKYIKITGSGLGVTDHTVSGIEPVEPVFEEINWQIKTCVVQVVNS